ncbi:MULTISPECIES: MurR/RpiR family transcriptional regulator [Buttiauxella]|uniref:MurR/RpiR family transcriptional regulator n=1 Tax=Buttiauxella TaxID=82976 RepID=UPI0010669682|nr:MurR/RpiR family transcriptional regulator [Buttiauxella sp. BIGb0552]TDX16841.1 RpiR family transcriptional regulator [Buttiauxella sp. BIGb0552]
MNKENINLLINIRNMISGMSPVLGQVGRFVTENPEYVMRHTITELADSIETSEGSITRFCRAAGFKGFADFRTALALEQGANQPAQMVEPELKPIIDSICDSNKILNSGELNTVATKLHEASHVAIYAVGTAVPVAMLLQMNLMRMGKSASLVERLYQPITPDGIVIAIHITEVSADMLQMLAHAKQRGYKIISLSRGSFHPFTQLADWNLQAAVSCVSGGEGGFAEIAGTMMVVDRLLNALEKKDERYSEHREANQKSIFSIDSITNKLSEYFMS